MSEQYLNRPPGSPRRSGQCVDASIDPVRAKLEKVAGARSVNQLEAWINDVLDTVRGEVADHPCLTVGQAIRLSQDSDWVVRWTLAARRDPRLSRILAHDSNKNVRAVCLLDPDLDPSLRRQLMADPRTRTVYDVYIKCGPWPYRPFM